MVLKFINEQMSVLNIPYEFGEWTSEVQYPYSVGEIVEPEPTTEDGMEEPEFLLTAFYRGSEPYSALENIKEKVKKHFEDLRAKTDEGTIAVSFGGASYIPTGEADLKRLQINLKIKTWKGA